MREELIDVPPAATSAEGQTQATNQQQTLPRDTGTAVALSGRRQAFQDIKRQLREEDLTSPGVQRLVLEDLERAETRCEALQVYVDRFHEADKRAAILEVSLKNDRAADVVFGLGTGLGGILIGLAPSNLISGWMAGILGALLIIGATIFRAMRR